MTDRCVALLALLAMSAIAPAQAQPATWSVSAGGNTVYLFGSVHVLPDGGFSIADDLDRAYRDAAEVCFEIDSSALDPSETAALTLARAIDPDGRSLSDLLGPDAERARTHAAAAGIDLAQFERFEPWFAGLTISLLALRQHGYDVEHGVEQVIEAAADRDAKRRCGLETVDAQLEMLDSLPADLQRELLLQSIEEAGEVDKLFGAMIAAWRAGDEPALADSLAADFDGYPELAERLIYARNERWAGQVEELLEQDDDVLLVVGALHLVGDRGLPALLRARGLRVERR